MENNKILTISSGIVAVFLVGVILRLAKPVLFPFFLAIFFYFILSPVLDFLTKLKVPKMIAVVAILLFTFLVIYLMGILFYSSGETFAAEFPKYGQKLSGMLESLQESLKLPKAKWEPLAWVEGLDINKLGSFFLASAGTILSFISNLFLILIFLVFMLAGRGKLNLKLKNALHAHRAGQWIRIIDNIDRQVQGYLALKTLICIVSGILATLILVVFGVKFAVVFGFMTLLLNYIPNIGPLIAKILPFVFALLQFEKFWPAFWVLAVLFAVDAVLTVVEPRLMGQRLGLSPLAILFALFFWGWLWGIPGMILAVPIMVIMKIVCSNFPSLKFVEVLMSK
jgi:predicted PurR-regulated permease PerM